jgi:hypothetical protein
MFEISGRTLWHYRIDHEMLPDLPLQYFWFGYSILFKQSIAFEGVMKNKFQSQCRPMMRILLKKD